MNKEEKKKEIKKMVNGMSEDELEGLSALKSLFLEVASKFDPSAKLMKTYSDLNDEMQSIMEAVYFDLPDEERSKESTMENVKNFTGVLEQFLQVCKDYKKENL